MGFENPSSTWELPETDSSDEKLEAIHTPQELRDYLEMAGVLDKFEAVDLRDTTVKEELKQPSSGKTFWRGMPPHDVVSLLQGNPVDISPYRYNQAEELQPSEDVQNATRLFKNAISHGAEREGEVNFLAAIEFDASDLEIKPTGSKMVQKFQERNEAKLLPTDKDLDVSIEGTLYPDKVRLVVFRFGEELLFRKAIYKPKVA
jgi:hypothetical protein